MTCSRIADVLKIELSGSLLNARILHRENSTEDVTSHFLYAAKKLLQKMIFKGNCSVENLLIPIYEHLNK